MGGHLIDEDEWQRRATAAAITAARQITLGKEAAIPTNTPIGRLSDIEWGWIAAAVIFAWISTRAEQAGVEGLDVEQAVRRRGGFDPDPWDAGAVAAMLPRLADVRATAQRLAAQDRDQVSAERVRAHARGLTRARCRRRLGHAKVDARVRLAVTGGR